jgi:hypothetical protein
MKITREYFDLRKFMKSYQLPEGLQYKHISGDGEFTSSEWVVRKKGWCGEWIFIIKSKHIEVKNNNYLYLAEKIAKEYEEYHPNFETEIRYTECLIR